jgi:hypothetical protein
LIDWELSKHRDDVGKEARQHERTVCCLSSSAAVQDL